jgi:hypothetical protein
VSTVKVTSIEALESLRAALKKFDEEGIASLQAIKLTLQKAIDWVEIDRPAYWKTQTKLAFDRVAAARTALSTCQMRTVAGRHPSCIEEKVALDKAKRRLQFCQEQIERVKKWGVKVRHEADEFRGRIAGLQKCLDGEVPAMAEVLSRSIAALTAYVDGNVGEETGSQADAVENAQNEGPVTGSASGKMPPQ